MVLNLVILHKISSFCFFMHIIQIIDWIEKRCIIFCLWNVVCFERNMILPIAVNQTNWVTNPFRVTRLSIWWCTYTKLQILLLHFMLLLINLQLPYLHSSPFTFKVVFMWLCVCVYLYLCVWIFVKWIERQAKNATG